MKFECNKIIGKKTEPMGAGVLSSDSREAVFFTGNDESTSDILGRLERPEMTSITSDGFRLRGFEETGFEKDGTKKFRYMEWWCRYLPET
jgi:hypothetical protein